MTGKPNDNIMLKFAFVCVLVILVFAVVNMQMQLAELRESKKQLEDSLQRVTDVIEETTIRLNTPLSDEYIERVAREKLGYRKPGEIIFYNDLTD